MTSYLKQLSEKSRQNADNAKEPQGGREEDVGEYNSPFLASADVPPVILDESFGKDMRKDEMVLIIQNLMKENFLLRDTICKTNTTMNTVESVLKEVHKKQQATEAEMQLKSEQAKSIIFDLRRQIKSLRNYMLKKQSNEQESKPGIEQDEAIGLELEEYKTKLSYLKKECDMNRNDKDNMKKKMEQAEKKFSDLNLRMKELQDEMKRVKDECDLRESQMSQLVQQNKKLVEEKKHSREANQQLLEQKQKLEAEVGDLRHNLSLLKGSESADTLVGKEGDVRQQGMTFSETDGKLSRARSVGDMKSDENYKAQLEAEKQKVIDLTTRINELTVAAYNHDNIATLKAQVVCLLKEVSESEIRLSEAYSQAEHFRERCKELESQNASLRTELESLRSKDDHLIDSLRLTVSEMERTLADQNQKNEEQRAMIEDYRITIHELQEECRILKSKLEKAKTLSSSINTSGSILITVEEKREQEDKLGCITAQLITAEDNLMEKQEEIQKLQEKIILLKRENQDIPYLRSQIDSHKRDFEDEKRARLYEHQKLVEAQEELEEMRLFSRELQSQLEQLSLQHLASSQRSTHPFHSNIRSGHMRGEQYLGGGFDECDKPIAADTQAKVVVKEEADNSSKNQAKGNEQMTGQVPGPAIQGGYTCPTCGLKTLDYDSLAIHADECLQDSNC